MAVGKIGQKIRIPGWFLEDSARDRRKNSAPQEAAHRIRLGSSYVHSIRRFDLAQLETTADKRFAGHYLNPRRVRGIVDLSTNSLEKFFINEEDVPVLEHLISLFKGDEMVLGSKEM
jgi:hypothetical protein